MASTVFDHWRAAPEDYCLWPSFSLADIAFLKIYNRDPPDLLAAADAVRQAIRSRVLTRAMVEVLPLEEVLEAHCRLAARGVTGMLVLKCD